MDTLFITVEPFSKRSSNLLFLPFLQGATFRLDVERRTFGACMAMRYPDLYVAGLVNFERRKRSNGRLWFGWHL